MRKLKDKLGYLMEHDDAHKFFSILIIINAIILGLETVPGMLHMAAVIALIFYIFALVGHDIFSVSNPDLFGTLGASMMTLLLILLGDGIGDAIHATMQTYEFSYIFFILYAAVMSFTLLNLLFGIIVDAVQSAAENEVSTNTNTTDKNDKILAAISKIDKHIKNIESKIQPL